MSWLFGKKKTDNNENTPIGTVSTVPPIANTITPPEPKEGIKDKKEGADFFKSIFSKTEDQIKAESIYKELKNSLDGSLNFNIYLDKHEIKNAVSECLDKNINKVFKPEEIYTLTNISKFVKAYNPKSATDDLVTVSQSTTGQIDGSGTTTSQSELTDEDANIAKCWQNIQIIVAAINKFNSNYPDYKIELRDVHTVKNYYYYIYIYRLVRHMERYLNTRTNHIYLLTYLISSVYDESTIPLDIQGETGYLNITPEYLNIFKAVVNARRTSPILSKAVDGTPALIPNLDDDVEIFKVLLAVLFKFDTSLRNFIDGQRQTLVQTEEQKDKGSEDSDALKQINKISFAEQTKSTIAKLREKMSSKFVGGGLIFDFSKGDKFLNEKQFYQIFDIEKIKVLSNKRTMEKEQFYAFINYIKNLNKESKNILSNITPDLWTGFVLYVVKFYKINGITVKETVEELNKTIISTITKSDDEKNNFKVRLDELHDIVVTKDPVRQKEAGEKAKIAKMVSSDDVAPTPAAPVQQVESANIGTTDKLNPEEQKKKEREEAKAKLLQPPSKEEAQKRVQGALIGGSRDPYYEKYLKYKNKYMELKNKR